jgi:hypothetical protein
MRGADDVVFYSDAKYRGEDEGNGFRVHAGALNSSTARITLPLGIAPQSS